MLHPLTFHPIFKDRVWGGRRLEQLYNKNLPTGLPIGESWEVTDRPGDISVIANGPLAGKDLHWLLEHHGAELLGAAKMQHGRFPLLTKILDAQEKLSIQVHPPTKQAAELGGEPKTEMWYIADAAPGAELFVGLRRGVTREEFGRKLAAGTVEECCHRIQVKSGDAMFLPSGRLHAIGAGLVIFEIQQNSDTTYRVFDWNRLGLDGKPRTLHVKESLASIDFNDFEPGLIRSDLKRTGPASICPLVSHPLFTVELYEAHAGAGVPLPPHKMQILAVIDGQLGVRDNCTTSSLDAGGFGLVPACLSQCEVRLETPARFLRIEAGQT
jgi:mannose-6-phosphate isomerase